MNMNATPQKSDVATKEPLPGGQVFELRTEESAMKIAARICTSALQLAG